MSRHGTNSLSAHEFNVTLYFYLFHTCIPYQTVSLVDGLNVAVNFWFTNLSAPIDDEKILGIKHEVEM